MANWRRLLEMASRCHEATGLGYLGVDLVVDAARGPLLLELNARPGLAIQIANGFGLAPRIAAVDVAGDVIRVVFEPAYLVKTMTGSVERTRWWQNGALVFDGAELDADEPLPELPAECSGGDVGENVYVRALAVDEPRGSIWVGTSVGAMEIDGQVSFIGSISDLSEVKGLETQLRHSQKMDAIGQLAGGVAHDFNNLLTVMGACVESLRDEVPEDAGEFLDELVAAQDRGAVLRF